LQTRLKNSESLERIRDQIVLSAKREGINIFYRDPLSTDDEEYSLCEIDWQADRDWRDFISIAKSEGVKLLILEENIFKFEDLKESIDELKDDVELPLEGADSPKELVGRLGRFSRYDGELGAFKIFWIQGMTKYCLNFWTSWYDQLQNLIAPFLESGNSVRNVSGYSESDIVPRKSLPKQLSTKPIEQVVDEVLRFLKDQYGDLPDFPDKTALDAFWESKGIERWQLDGKARLFLDRVAGLVVQRLEEERRKRENQKIPDLIQECIDWAKENDLRKLTKSNLKAFLAEKGEQLSKNSENIVLFKANLELKD
jgi:hypothetical protein